MEISSLNSPVYHTPASMKHDGRGASESDAPLRMHTPSEGAVSSESTPAGKTDLSYYIGNPYEDAYVSDEVWEIFVKAAEGFDTSAMESAQQRLFDEESGNEYSMNSALSLLDWSKRAEAIKDNILLPQSSAVNIPENQKRMIADQMKAMLGAQLEILDRFQYFTQNGGIVSLDLVA